MRCEKLLLLNPAAVTAPEHGDMLSGIGDSTFRICIRANKGRRFCTKNKYLIHNGFLLCWNGLLWA